MSRMHLGLLIIFKKKVLSCDKSKSFSDNSKSAENQTLQFTAKTQTFCGNHQVPVLVC